MRLFRALAHLEVILLVCLGVSVAADAQLPSTIDLKNGEEDVTIYGAEAGDELTRSRLLTVGDLNNDGVMDLLIGAQWADGPTIGRLDCGQIYVYFSAADAAGTLDGAGVVGDPPDVIIYGATADDRLGNSGAIIGDVNGDGINDLITGIARGDGPADTRTTCGEAYILFGRSTWPSTMDLADGDQDVTIYGAQYGDNLTSEGSWVIADFNDDGMNDLVLGADNADGPSNSRSRAGEAYVFYGRSTWPTSMDIASGAQDVIIYGASGSVGSSPADRLTNDGSVACGDLNGDGISDLVLGAHYALRTAPPGADNVEGEAYIIYGSSSLASSIDLGSGEEDVTIVCGLTAAHLTRERTIQTGDLNGDGVDDLALGAYTDSTGWAFVIYGSSSLSSTITLSSGEADVTVTGPAYLTKDGLMAIANVNADGVKDLILGVENGKVSVIFGSGSLPATVDLNAYAEDAYLHSGPNPVERALAAADVNGDGVDDIIVGGGTADGPTGDTRTDAGGAFIVYGSAGLSGEMDLSSTGPDVTIYGATAGDMLTYSDRVIGSFGVGDLNDDGLYELIMGADGGDGPSESRTDCGEAYIIFGATAAASATVEQTDHPGDPLPETYGTAATTIDFSSGDNASTTTVTRYRGAPPAKAGDDLRTATVYWRITTDRTNFSADVTFRYTTSEIAGMDEATLQVYQSSSLSGPYTPVTTVLNTDQNTATATGLTSFSYFILKGAKSVPASRVPGTVALAAALGVAGVMLVLRLRRQ